MEDLSLKNKIMKKYFYKKIQQFILYFISEFIEEFSIKPLHKKIDIQQKEIKDTRFDLAMTMKESINNKRDISILYNILNKLSSDSVTVGLDISGCKEDMTNIIILSRINGKDTVEFIEKRFDNIYNLYSFIDSVKRTNFYVDKPQHLIFNPKK